MEREEKLVNTQGKTRELVLFSLFTALTAIGAFIRVPVPLCPFTLQLLFTTLAGLILGSKKRCRFRSGLCCFGFGRCACIYPGRRTGVYFPADIRLSFGIYCRSVVDGKNL